MQSLKKIHAWAQMQDPLYIYWLAKTYGDVAHNINPDICFLTKAKWPKI